MVIKQIRKLYLKLFPQYRRLEMRCVTYAEGDRLIKEDQSWVLAKEEDTNFNYGVVFLERKERILE